MKMKKLLLMVFFDLYLMLVTNKYSFNKFRDDNFIWLWSDLKINKISDINEIIVKLISWDGLVTFLL